MFKKLLILSLCSSSFLSNVYAETVEDLINTYDEFSPQKKETLVTNFKQSGWVTIVERDTSIFRVNYNDIKVKSPAVADAWIKEIVSERQIEKGLTIGDYTMTHAEYDCAKGTMLILSLASYDFETKKIIESEDYTNKKPEVQKINTGTYAEEFYKTVCFMHYVKSH